MSEVEVIEKDPDDVAAPSELPVASADTPAQSDDLPTQGIRRKDWANRVRHLGGAHLRSGRHSGLRPTDSATLWPGPEGCGVARSGGQLPCGRTPSRGVGGI